MLMTSSMERFIGLLGLAEEKEKVSRGPTYHGKYEAHEGYDVMSEGCLFRWIQR